MPARVHQSQTQLHYLCLSNSYDNNFIQNKDVLSGCWLCETRLFIARKEAFPVADTLK